MSQPRRFDSNRLASLAGHLSQQAAAAAAPVVKLAVSSISANPDQPRKQFREESLRELGATIRTKGLVQPVIVRQRAAGRYELIAGERRWRAAKIAGVDTIDAIVRDVSDPTETLGLALLENLGREDMPAIDEITGVAAYVAKTSVQATATLLGKSTQWVSKRKRIAEAPSYVRQFAASGATSDVEALYELAQLADSDEIAVRRLIAQHTPGAHLRAIIRAHRAPNDAAGDKQPAEPRASDDPRPESAGRRAAAARASGATPSARPAATGNGPAKVSSVSRRGHQLLCQTDRGPIPLELTPALWQKLRKLSAP
jgi:ParB family chromosome partitioning protein